MGVDMPVHCIASILKDQLEWEKKRERKSNKSYLYQRFVKYTRGNNDLHFFYYRNIQKKAKKMCHEQEKSYMATLCGMGSAVGEYVRDGQGESSTTEALTTSVDIDDAKPGLDDQSQNDEVVSSDNANPLLIFYDCETTRLSIYNDHITDIGAKVVASPVPLETPTFTSLVATSRRIPSVGKQ